MGFQKDLSFQFESQVFLKFQNLGFILNNLILTTSWQKK